MLALGSLLPLLALAGSVEEAERATMAAWFHRAWLRDTAPAARLAGLSVERQDYGTFRLGRSVMDTPLRIGTVDFAHGLGTHAESRVRVTLPRPAKTFSARVGVDHNYDTQGRRGSVEFSVAVGGQTRARTPVLRGGQAPVELTVELAGADELVLRVTNGGDGYEYDQSDWADARVTLDDDSTLWLDSLPVLGPPLLGDELPCSFDYGGLSSRDLLAKWLHERHDEPDGRTRLRWREPGGGLEFVCEARLHPDSPAVEWVSWLHNRGTTDSSLVERWRALDLRVAPPRGEIVLHHAHGSTCAETDFLPLATPLGQDARVTLAPRGGRSSDGALPFVNLAWPGGGLVAAVGWTGQWQFDAQRAGTGPLRLLAGQQTTHFKLAPGESARSPRLLLVGWQGAERWRGQNLLRRTLLAHYTPQRDGRPALPPVTQNTWFTFNEGNRVNEANQLESLAPMAATGVESYWLDAGWFEGGWPAGAGSWVPRADAFPRGLRPLGDAAHAAGLKFVLWLEPERVNPASRIAREHPAWVLHRGAGDGLFNLGEPAARAWLTDFLDTQLRAWGVDVYRQDFNIEPLGFWQQADTPDRRGLTENHYVQGLYALWDDLVARAPARTIDNCASGGRRIDLETSARSYPLWRSDTPCGGRARPEWDQAQTAGLSSWVPLHSTGVWGFDPYTWFSAAVTGANVCPDTRASAALRGQLAQRSAETKALRELCLGEFYPLLPITTDPGVWAAWQWHRADLEAGVALFFRRAGSPYRSVAAGLRALAATGEYEVRRGFDGAPERVTGAALANALVELPSAPGLALWRYQRVQVGPKP